MHARPRQQGSRALRGIAGMAALTLLGWVVPTADAETAPVPPTAPSPRDDATSPLPGPAPEVKDLGDGRFRIGRVTMDTNRKSIIIPATVHMEKGAVEYVLVTAGGKVHETVLTTEADPAHIHLAALLLGMQPSPDLGPEMAAAKPGKGGSVEAWLEWDRNGPPARIPLTDTVAVTNPNTQKIDGPLPAGLWLYNGSRILQDRFLATTSGSVISLIRDHDALVNNPGASRDNDEIHTPNAARLPKLRTPVRVVLKVR